MERVFNHPEALERLTGLRPRAFEAALKKYEYAQENVLSCETVMGKERRKASGGGLKSDLTTPKERFLFILTYYHLYPTQSTIASFFGMTQQWASTWIRFLTPLAEEALERHLAPPARVPLRMPALLEREPLVLLLTDAWKSGAASFHQNRKKSGPKPRPTPTVEY